MEIRIMGMKLFCAYIAVILLLCGCSHKPKLVRVRVRVSGGYMDVNGKIVIKPQFSDEKPFSEGLAAVMNDSSAWGYIDSTGKMVIKPQFDEACEFVEDRAAVKIPEPGKDPDYGKYSLIDHTGRVLAKCVSDQPFIFSEGLAGVEKGCKSGYIDKDGKMVIKPCNNDFHSGLAACNNDDGLCYYINHKGKIVLKLHADNVSDFSEGLARFSTSTESESQYGYINIRGEKVIAPGFADGSDFKSGLAWVRVGQRSGYIDKTGRMAIKGNYESMSDFQEGLACVWSEQNGKTKIGYIDKKGKWAIKPIFEEGESFNCGRAFVQLQDGTYGYIDKTGKVTIRLKYGPFGENDSVEWGFSDGLAIYWTTEWIYVEEDDSDKDC